MKSVKFFNITSHNLTEDQRKIIERAGFEIVELPKELKARWSNIPPDADNRFLAQLSNDVWRFIHKGLNTYPSFVLVQGEPVVCYDLVFSCAQTIPLVATTRRDSIEVTQPDGSVKKESVFRHVQFRPYKLYHASLVKKVGLA